MEKRIIARNTELKDIINDMNVEDVETIYNTLQKQSGEDYSMGADILLISGLPYYLVYFFGLAVNPFGMQLTAILHFAASIFFRAVAMKRKKFEANNERVDEITNEYLGASYNELSLGTQMALYINSKRRMRKEKKEAKIKRK